MPGQSREAARQPVRTAATAPAASGPAIQVGSYRTEAEAFGRLRDVQRTHGAVLAGTAPTTQRIVLKGRQYYRARFVGLGVRAARSACADLTSRGVSCIVLR
ncbi:MAG: SPOR domain-containing protein [Pseudomonadota bacterium]